MGATAAAPASQAPMERISLLLLAASTLLAVAAFTTPVWGHFDEPPSPAGWVGRASGLSLIGAGFLASRWRSARRIARLLLLSATLYYVPFLIASSSDVLFTIALASRGAWIAVGNHFVLAFPEGRLRSPLERALVVAGYAWLTLGAFLTNAFLDPRAAGPLQVADATAGCTTCPENLLLVAHDPALHQLVLYPAGLIPATIAVLAIAVLARRWHRATRPERRVVSPVFTAFAVNVVFTIAAYLSAALRGARLIPVEVSQSLFVIQAAMVVLIPIGVLVGLLRSLMARSAVGNLLVRIGDGNSSAEVERDVAWALGDPAARLVYRRGEEDAFSDLDGRLVEPLRATTVVGTTGELVVAIAHDPALGEHQPELLEAVVAAARLALENQRLETEVQLSRQLPHGLADRLLAEGGVIGQTRMLRISVLMSDVRGYSSLAERADLGTLTAQLHEHRAAMNRAIAAQGGTVMQYAGDSVFSVFGAPMPMPDHAPRAVRAAIEMQAAQAAINESWKAAGWPAFELGIGVTTGDVAAALLGSEEHLEYSVVGDVVNLAQRIQGWATGGEIVVSEATHSGLGGEFGAERIPTARVKGRAGMVTAYRVSTA